MKKIKIENYILIMLAFFSVSMGLWENFRQLWLQDNNFTVTNISNIISIGTLISVIGIFFIGKSIKVEKLKNVIILSLIIKFINAIFLFYLNGTKNSLLINCSIIIDLLTGYIITTSIYPLITTVVKNNTIYSKRKLTEYLFKDIGIFVGGILIGRSIIGIFVNYNVCLLISAILLILSTIIMISIPSDKTQEQNDSPKISILKYILKSKLQITLYTYLWEQQH